MVTPNVNDTPYDVEKSSYSNTTERSPHEMKPSARPVTFVAKGAGALPECHKETKNALRYKQRRTEEKSEQNFQAVQVSIQLGEENKNGRAACSSITRQARTTAD